MTAVSVRSHAPGLGPTSHLGPTRFTQKISGIDPSKPIGAQELANTHATAWASASLQDATEAVLVLMHHARLEHYIELGCLL